MNYEQALEIVVANFPSVKNRTTAVVAEMIANAEYCNKAVIWEKDGEVFACR